MVTAQLSYVIGSGVPSLVAPMGGVATIVTIGLAFLVASVVVMALGNRSRAS
jgi:hypothetical protein